MKYKKRGIVIEAVKWEGDNVQEIVDFTSQKVFPFTFNPVQITTGWGVMECKVGDMVMKGINGEIYSCDADVFTKSYEAVEGREYRKLPIIIEAIQLTWSNWNEVCEFVPKEVFVSGCYLDENGKETLDANGKLGLKLKTLEGILTAKENDWIIRGVKGEYYYNSPETFEKTYERID